MTTYKLLVIDDDENYGALTVQRLELAGFDVTFQHGPFGSSLHAARKGEFDVIIIDVNMPGLSGTSLFDLMKRGERRSRVVLYSSMDEKALVDLQLKHGADDWFSKASTADELVSIVKRLCLIGPPPAAQL